MLLVDLQKESTETSKMRHGHVVVGATAVQVEPITAPLAKGVLLRAPGPTDPAGNTAPIWLGRSNVTADSAVGTGGMPLLPGASVYISIDDLSELYAVSTAASQDLAWMGV